MRSCDSRRKTFGNWGLLVAVALLLAGCKTQRIVEVHDAVTIHDTIRLVEVQRDSIYKCDSVFVNQYVQGDTVFRDREKWVTFYKDKVKIDTLVQVRDSIVYKEIKVAEKKSPNPIFAFLDIVVVGVIAILAAAFIWKICK